MLIRWRAHVMAILHIMGLLLLASATGLASHSAYGRGTYLEPSAFIEQVFDGAPPEPKRIWLTSELRERMNELPGGSPVSLRMRYWERDGRTAWVLEAIGKEQPITVGFVVSDNRIERTEVLIFRESRGFEIRYPFFTDQFRGVGLNSGSQLDADIDGITGATMSVRAMTSMAKLALLLHRHALAEQEPRRYSKAN
jgi:hypothetical protein